MLDTLNRAIASINQVVLGKEQQVRELLRSYEIEIVDALVKQQVLVVTGEKQQIEQLSHSDLIDYTEPEPTRMLYAQ